MIYFESGADVVKKKETLSEKIYADGTRLLVEDVREAVKKLKGFFCLNNDFPCSVPNQCSNCEKINEIFGEELSK